MYCPGSWEDASPELPSAASFRYRRIRGIMRDMIMQATSNWDAGAANNTPLNCQVCPMNSTSGMSIRGWQTAVINDCFALPVA